MVKIINGEIVADDDPRLKQRQQQHSPDPRSGETGPGARPGAGVGPGGGIGFSLSAPPLRFVPPPPGVDAPLGIPDAEVFGVRISPYAILSAIALGMFFGWRGVVVVLVLYYVYLASQNNAAGQAGAQGGGAGAAPGQQQQQQQASSGPAADWLQRYLDGPKPRSRASGTGLGATGAGHGAGGASWGLGAGQQGGEPAPQGNPRAGVEGAAGGKWAAFQGQGQKLGGK